MKVDINKDVTYALNNVEITSVLLTKRKDKINITTPYKWLDVDGNNLREGVNSYKEEELSSLPDSEVVCNALKSLIPDEDVSAMFRFTLSDTEVTAESGYNSYTSGKAQWIRASMNEAELETLLVSKGLSIQGIKDLLDMFTRSIFQ